MAFYGAQTFLIDPTVVSGASSVMLSRVRLFFKHKPLRTGNRSGITAPGVTVFLVPSVNGIPSVGDISGHPSARCEYEEIKTSTDATAPTNFTFPDLPPLTTAREYAVVVAFDGQEDFRLWTSIQGQRLIGTVDTPSPGSSGQYVGKWYEYITPAPGGSPNQANTNLVQTAQTGNTSIDYTATGWRPLNSVDLKFQVFCARFSINGSANLTPLAQANTLVPAAAVVTNPTGNVQVSDTGTTFTIPSIRYEYVSYDGIRSKAARFRVGERVWQRDVYYPDNKAPATASVTDGSRRVSASVDLSDVFDGAAVPEYIVLVSLSHPGGTRHDLRRVQSVDDTAGTILLEDPVSFSNSACYFYKPTVATVERILRTTVDGDKADVLILRDSNANSQQRFVNNSVLSISVGSGGTGYHNNDLVVVTGFENVAGVVIGGYPARAKVLTDGSGTITQVYMANQGSGFVNASSMVIAVTNSSGGTPNGSAASLTANVGMMICSEFSYVPTSEGFCLGKLFNPTATENFLATAISNPLGTFLNALLRLSYFKVADSNVFGGWRYNLDSNNNDNDVFHITAGKKVLHKFKKNRCLPSWSNELVICYPNGTGSNGAGTAANNVGNNQTLTSNSSVLTVVAASNNDFTFVKPGPTTIVYSRYLVNDDYSNEHTNYGSAVSKGVTSKANFAEGTNAEDLLVYLTAWRPPGTDLKVFARLHNSQDTEAFDDKDWTLLRELDTVGRTSSATNESDLIELGYGIPQYPNTGPTLPGTVTTQLNNTTLTGSGTNFNTSLANGDLIRIYNPLFANTNHRVVLVETVVNDTALTLEDGAINDNGIVGAGLKVEKILYPHQAFKDILNDNVVRYYNGSMAQFDTFDTMQFKVVFVAASENLVPKVDDIRATGTSA